MQRFSWVLDEGKFLTSMEIEKLQSVLEERKHQANRNNTKTAIRDWCVINLALYTGLRVQEISNLLIGDLFLENESSSLIVRNGKNGKSRLIKFSNKFREILLEYLNWKTSIGEPISPAAPLIYSSISKNSMTTRGVQKIFERNAKRAGIKGHSIHHLRHTYASHLYKSSNYNLRLVQKQLGHSSIKITEVYADVLRPDLDHALDNLYSDIPESNHSAMVNTENFIYPKDL